MTPNELQNILLTRGYSCVVRKDEVVMDVCVYCGNTHRNLELNAPLGVYHCWACRNGGRLQDFLNDFLSLDVHIAVSPLVGTSARESFDPRAVPGVPGEPAQKFQSAVMYLRRRGFRLGDFIRYGFRVATDDKSEGVKQYYGRLIIPVREFWTQESAGFVARGYVGEKPKYLSDVRASIVGYLVQQRSAVYTVSEGMFDGIAAHRAGCNAAVLLGRGGTEQFEEWVARVPGDAPICLLLDADAEEQSVSLWWRARAVRPDVKRAQLPNSLDPAKIAPDILAKFIRAEMAKQDNPTLVTSDLSPSRSRVTLSHGDHPC